MPEFVATYLWSLQVGSKGVNSVTHQEQSRHSVLGNKSYVQIVSSEGTVLLLALQVRNALQTASKFMRSTEVNISSGFGWEKLRESLDSSGHSYQSHNWMVGHDGTGSKSMQTTHELGSGA